MAGDATLEPNVHLDEHERRITVRALDLAIGRRQQIEKRQGAARTMRASELAVHKTETQLLQAIADRLDGLSEATS